MPQPLYPQKRDLLCILQEGGWASGPGFNLKENIRYAVTSIRNHASQFHCVMQGCHAGKENTWMRIFTHNLIAGSECAVISFFLNFTIIIGVSNRGIGNITAGIESWES